MPEPTDQEVAEFGNLGDPHIIQGGNAEAAPPPQNDEWEIEGIEGKVTKSHVANMYKRQSEFERATQNQNKVVEEYNAKSKEMNELLDYLEGEKAKLSGGGQKDIEITMANGKSAKLQHVVTTLATSLQQLNSRITQMDTDRQIAEFQKSKGINDDEMRDVLKFVVEKNIPDLDLAYKGVFFDKLGSMKEEEAMSRISNLMPPKANPTRQMSDEERAGAELLHYGKFI